MIEGIVMYLGALMAMFIFVELCMGLYNRICWVISKIKGKRKK